MKFLICNSDIEVQESSYLVSHDDNIFVVGAYKISQDIGFDSFQ